MNRNIENHRVAPSTSELYRRFAEKWQAEQFIGGEIRMRNLLSYRQEKDETRRDEWEGDFIGSFPWQRIRDEIPREIDCFWSF